MTAQTLQDLPDTVFGVWVLALAEAALIVLPLTIYFLRRALKTARRIQRDLKEMAEAAALITQRSDSLSSSIRSIDMTALLQLAESLHEPPVQVDPPSTGLVHAGNGKNPGGVS